MDCFFISTIQNASYLAEQGLDVIDSVLDALSRAGYDNQKVKKVMIQSSSSAVLMKLKEKMTNYELVYDVREVVRDIQNSTIADINKFASSLVIEKKSVYSEDHVFLSGSTGLVPKLKALKLSVYVSLFRNEYLSQAYDFFADPHVELNTFFVGAGIDGVITDFPGTANRYRSKLILLFTDASLIFIIWLSFLISFIKHIHG